jgi:predicted methyltransferase
MSTRRTWIVLGWIASIAVIGCGSSGSGNGQANSPDETAAAQTGQTDKAAADQADRAGQADGADAVAAAVAHPGRPEDDRARDADRKPDEVLRFFGIRPGMKVAELMAGTGYYVELLGRVVGPEGHVYAQNSDFIVNRFPMDKLEARLARPELAHVEHVVQELDALALPEGQLDAILMVLFYHDTYWMKVDRARMNAGIFAALAPGGIYGVIDHVAEDGSGERDVKSLHRGDVAMIKQEILDAGFEFVGESEALRHPEDDRTRSAFDKTIRGKTDRVVYKFRKPAR